MAAGSVLPQSRCHAPVGDRVGDLDEPSCGCGAVIGISVGSELVQCRSKPVAGYRQLQVKETPGEPPQDRVTYKCPAGELANHHEVIITVMRITVW